MQNAQKERWLKVLDRIIDNVVELIRKDEYFLDYASYPLKGTKCNAEVILKDEAAVISGVEIVSGVCERFNIKAEFLYKDGDLVKKGKVAQIHGDAYNILICERSILNVLSFMSAIATKVRKLVEKADGKVQIAATRKTIPFTGELQKIAVLHGGGDTHRLNLSDCAMIKDNHIKLYGSITRAVNEVKKHLSFTKKIEVEAETLEMAVEACQAGSDIVMLDNFSPQEACRAARLIKERYPDVIVEISGGVNPDNIEEYVCEYIDVISIGRITSEVKYVDYSLEVL